MSQQEVRCENIFKKGQCDRPAKVRAIKKELFRVYNRNHVTGDVDRCYREMIHEKFLCVGCALEEEDYGIVEWIVEKIPYEILFNVKDFSIKDAKQLGLKYWELLEEKRLRWEEQVFCSNCGNKINHEVRYYTNNDGYDSPNRWVNAHKIVHCKNCGFFDCDYVPRTLGYDRKKDDAGEYHGYKKPDNDPDYRKWEEISKKSKVLEEESK